MPADAGKVTFIMQYTEGSEINYSNPPPNTDVLLTLFNFGVQRRGDKKNASIGFLFVEKCPLLLQRQMKKLSGDSETTLFSCSVARMNQHLLTPKCAFIQNDFLL